MLVVPEAVAARLVSVEDAIEAVAAAFAAADRGMARSFPVVREAVGHADAVFGVKTGFDGEGAGAGPVLGLKAGGYWPGNGAQGIANHQSTTLLFDPETGQPAALVGANRLTGLRTGAAAAIATRHLARPDAGTLGLIGAGGQAEHQVRAVCAVRPIRRLIASDPSEAALVRLARLAADLNLAFETADPAAVASEADVLTTVTPSRAPLFMAEAARPGTHVNAMGTDTAGKQEHDPALVAAAAVYVDDPEQAVTIGECQHAAGAGLIARDRFAGTLGGLASGRLAPTWSSGRITLFDGTGVALQDLAVCALAWRRAAAAGEGVEVAFS